MKVTKTLRSFAAISLAVGALIVTTPASARAAAYDYVDCRYPGGDAEAWFDSWKTSSTRYSVSARMTGPVYKDGGATSYTPSYLSINGRWLSYAGTQTMTGFNSTAGVNATAVWIKKQRFGTGVAHQWTITCSASMYANGVSHYTPPRVVQNF